MDTTGTGRRKFLKTVATAGAIANARPALAQKAEPQTLRFGQRVAYPRKFTGRQLAMLAFPLGGVGAGAISLGGRGQLRDWEIFNRPDKGKNPQYAFASIWAQSGSANPVSRVLESRILPPYEGPSGLGSANVPGLPRLASATFTGEFPLARIDFEDSDLPVKVSLEAFTPFIPHEADDSGLPVAVLRYRVSNPRASKAKVAIAFSIDNPVGVQGRQNDWRQGANINGLLMRNPFVSAPDPLVGTFALCALKDNSGKLSYLRGWRGGTRWRVGPMMFWDDFSADGELGPEAPLRDTVGSLCWQKEIAARGETTFTFLLAWHFPNRTSERCGWTAPKGAEKAIIGNHYCTRFSDAWQAAEYAASKLSELEAQTREFATAMRETTLPSSIREAATANLSTLVVPTSFRTADGAFHGFEGSNNQVGCCFGNCTHVWNYEAATQFLYPSLARSLREAAFGFCTDDEGRMDFRQLLPANQERWGNAAADGQMGQIMKLYLDWRIAGDDEWLRVHWPAAKRAIQFAWIPGGWDANKDGVMEGVQHNTYDVEFLGPNPLCGVWYLGALRAIEEMAKAMNDSGAAAEYRRLFESGSKWIDANLFNGEYYVQKIQPTPKDKVAKGLLVGMGAADTENPDFQVGDGCLVDQLLGQYFSHIAGLGLLLDEKNIRKTLESIYKYNYKRALSRHESVQRVYALNDEAALVICDYGRGKRPDVPFPYFAEVMTGFEYSAAILMLHHGMVDQGLELIDNIRLRYDGERRNPWNEAECGHHYARAMASWAAIPALSGFSYDGVEKRIAAEPRVTPRKFRSFWSSGTGWGVFSQNFDARQKKFALSVKHGALACREVRLAWNGTDSGAAVITAGGKNVGHTRKLEGASTVFTLSTEVTLKRGNELTIELSPRAKV